MPRGHVRLWGLAILLSGALVSAACAGNTASRHQDTTRGTSPQSLGSASPTPTAHASATPRTRPNIVLLMTDDMALGDLAVMPRTRRLIARQGVTFTQAVSSYPLCCPARATVLTGLQAHNHGVMGNDPPWGGYTRFRDEKQTIGVWLQRAGYTTTLLGKYLNGYPRPGRETFVPPGWDNWLVPVEGIYNYDHYTINQNGRLASYTEYQSRYVADRTTTLIDHEARSTKPFFMWINFLAPHVGGPIEPDDPLAHDPDGLQTPAVEDRYRNSLASTHLPRDPSINERDVSDKDAFIRRLPIRPRRQLTEFYQQRLESLRSVDDGVGRIMEELRRSGALRNTVVMFVSDNGNAIGQHRWVKKVLGYEDSIRIPMLMRGPGLPAGTRVGQQVSLADLSATIVGLAGARPPHVLDGVDMRRMVGDPSYLAKRPMLLEAGGWPFPRQKRLYTGVRTADGLVYLRWFDGTKEVYDLRRDPYELDGRTSMVERRDVPRLEADRRVLETCRGASCNDLAR